MAKSVLDIIINTIKKGTGDTQVVKGLVELKGYAGAAGMAFGILAGAAYTVDKALDATAGKFVAYADQVRNVQFLTGATAEESSRLIQVADDMKIGYEALTKAMTAAVKNGIEPNIESIAVLSDQYLALAPGAERAKFLLDNFGKSGGEMAELLSKGSSAIREMAASMDGGLVLDQEAVDAAREYEMAVDTLTDSWDAFTITAGRKVLPILAQIVEGMNRTIAAQDDYNDKLQEVITKHGNYGDRANNMRVLMMQQREATLASRDALEEQKDSLEGYPEAMGGAADANRDFAQSLEEIDYGNLLSMTLDLQEGFDKFAEKETEIRQKMLETDAAFQNGTMSAAEHQQKMAELSGELDQNAAAMEDWSKRTVFALVQARLAASGGIDANEFAFLIGLGEQMGIIDSKTAEMAQKINDGLNSIDTSQGQESVDAFADVWNDLLDQPHEQTFTITTVTTETTDTSGSDQTGVDSGWCFLAGTRITLANYDRRNIEDFRSGDLVLTMDPDSGETSHGRVGRIFLHEAESYLQIRISNGEQLRVTDEHPIWTGTAWVKAGELGIGWNVRTIEGIAQVEHIGRINQRVPVYNLHVEHAWHTYFADGILVHNKATGGIIRAPGSGLQDTVMVPMAAGEGVLNARAMSMPGMANFLRAANAGALPTGGDKRVTIYGGVTVVVQQSADLKDVLTDIG